MGEPIDPADLTPVLARRLTPNERQELLKELAQHENLRPQLNKLRGHFLFEERAYKRLFTTDKS